VKLLRVAAASLLAAIVWAPLAVQTAEAIYCYPGNPPEVYQACLAYNQGIGLQVTNQRELNRIRSQIKNKEDQINALNAFINSLNAQIAAQQALIAKTQAKINDLDVQIRFTTADLTRLQASLSVRDALLDQRLRYVDAHGSINYVELVLTASTFNDLMNRMIGAQQVAASDQQLIDALGWDRAQFDQVNANLAVERGQMTALLLQQKATVADLQKNVVTQQQAVAYANDLVVQLQADYARVAAERKAIDARVAVLARKYDAAAEKAGGGSGVFTWPSPACNYSCITQGFGCSTFYLEPYDSGCPYPHRIHTGLDIAGPYRIPIVAADTGIVYLYPGSIGYGNLLVMIHGNGYSTYYGHLAGYAPGMHTGKIVARGDLIAYEGSTGWSTGPHLHFEIRINGNYKNPCIWLGC
jgi:murein DD-endopeptidase MepM/ murein hydrolase activator NlpD